MNSLVSTFFGSEDTVSVNDYEIVMNSGFPLWAVFMVAAGLGAYSWFLYKKETPNTTFKRRIGLAALRFGTCFLLFLLLLQPRIKMDTQQASRTVLPILIDISQSMTITEKRPSDTYLRDIAEASGMSSDEASKASRLEVVSSIINNQDLSLISDLQEKYAVRLYTFDQKTRQLQVEDEELITLPSAEGKATGLGPAVRYIEQSLKGLPLADLIIFTDGIHNKGESPLEVAEELSRKNIRVFPVGIGMPDNADLKILKVDVQELLFQGDETAIEVTFEANGIQDSDQEVELKLGDRTLIRKNILCRNGVFKEVFVVTPEVKGDFEFRVTLEKHEDEFFTGNNTMSKQVSVIDSEIRILLAVGNPSWEYRYLKGMLDGDKRFKTEVFIKSGDFSRSSSDPQYLSSFPYERLKEIDCIILNNIDRSSFSTDKMKLLQNYVVEQGGSIVMISSPSGTPSSFAGTPLEEILPVTIRKYTESEDYDFTANSRSFKLQLTEAGLQSIITRLDPHPEKNADVWETLPGQYWYYKGIRKLKPSATALVQHSSAKNEYGKIPLMAYHRFGRGQVLFLGFNSIWRWRYRIGSKYTDRFWGQTIQALGLPHLLGTMHDVKIETVGRDFPAAEKIDITCRLANDALNADADSISITAVNTETGDEKEFKIPPSAESGAYNGSIVLPEGLWDLQVEGHTNTAKHRINVFKSNLEFEKTSMDKVQLSQMAQLSGGQFVPLAAIAELPSMMNEKQKLKRTVFERSLWDGWLFLILICLLTSSEWLFRKQENLP
ncbi:MAG: VWA domain-containing protein [Lentisphaerales bacterium]|nr:VWA domain-containing protein [Lentisphaerales bacterium]